MVWQLQVAKQKFSDLVRRTLDEGPQVVSRHGEAVVVVVSVEEYRRLTEGESDFKDFLLSGPDPGRLDIRRANEPARAVEL